MRIDVVEFNSLHDVSEWLIQKNFTSFLTFKFQAFPVLRFL